MQHGNDLAAPASYRAPRISARLLIAATFISVLSACGGGGDTTTYTATPSVNGSGGAISPATAVSVNAGATTTFTLTPNSGYSASVDGTCGGSLSGNTYTTRAIAGNCTVVVTFTANNSAAPLKFVYESISPANRTFDDFLSIHNQEGAKGYFQSSFGFVNDGTKQTYSYMALTDFPSTMIDFMKIINDAGVKGYRFEGIFSYNFFPSCAIGMTCVPEARLSYYLFRKDSSSSATYTYATDPMPSSTAELLAQANSRGKSGYWLHPYLLRPLLTDNDIILYSKSNSSSAIYSYEILTSPGSKNGLLTQLNSEGTRGYRALTTLPFDTGFSPIQNEVVYIKDQTQAATFTYTSGASGEALAVTGLNSQGAQGFAYLGLMFNSPTYVKATSCKGFLCTAPGSAMYVNPYSSN
jgi:hypothetical protein